MEIAEAEKKEAEKTEQIQELERQREELAAKRLSDEQPATDMKSEEVWLVVAPPLPENAFEEMIALTTGVEEMNVQLENLVRQQKAWVKALADMLAKNVPAIPAETPPKEPGEDSSSRR